MPRFKERFRLLVLPILIIVTCFCSAYTLLHWLLQIKLRLDLPEEVIVLWLPATIPVVPLLIWLNPRIKLFDFKNDNGYLGYFLIAHFVVAIPTIIAQDYLKSATGKLTRLENINHFDKSVETKYYNLNTFYLDKDKKLFRRTLSVSGKTNNALNFSLYAVIPVYGNPSDTLNGRPRYWMGYKYTRKVKNTGSDAEKYERYNRFFEEARVIFNSHNFNNFDYLEVIGNTEDRAEYLKTIHILHPKTAIKQIIFIPKHGSFAVRNGNQLHWIFLSAAIGITVWTIIILFPKLDEKRLRRFKKGLPSKDQSIKEALSVLIPNKLINATPIIVDLNLLMFIIMAFSGLGVVSFKAIDLVGWGANDMQATLDGEWWRLLTSIFLHGGLFHLLSNMVGLLFAGFLLEPLIGRFRFVLLYLITGIVAAIASTLWHKVGVGVGASGAIFGLFGFLLAATIMKVHGGKFSTGFFIAILVFVGYNLLIGLNGGIDNAAHIGGLLFGFLIGLIASPWLKKKIKDSRKRKPTTSKTTSET